MPALLAALIVLAAVLAQVAVAPLFPLAGALVELPVVALVLLAFYAGPRAVMVGLPLLVLFLGFATNADFEWLVIAYLPLLPGAAWIQRQASIPQTPYLLALLVTIAAGGWARVVFAASAMLSGANPTVGPVIVEVLLPGAAFDALVLTGAYVLCRWLGWQVRSLSLEPARFEA